MGTTGQALVFTQDINQLASPVPASGAFMLIGLMALLIAFGAFQARRMFSAR